MGGDNRQGVRRVSVLRKQNGLSDVEKSKITEVEIMETEIANKETKVKKTGISPDGTANLIYTAEELASYMTDEVLIIFGSRKPSGL